MRSVLVRLCSLDLPSGPSVVLVQTLGFLLVLAFGAIRVAFAP